MYTSEWKKIDENDQLTLQHQIDITKEKLKKGIWFAHCIRVPEKSEESEDKTRCHGNMLWNQQVETRESKSVY